jgi:protein-tyrosine phosphatase
MSDNHISVLFVCMGNICRSPTAEGVFRSAVEEAGLSGHITVGSAEASSRHAGEPPDRRAQAAARKRGYDLSGQRARQVTPEDCSRFDYVLAMDRDNLARLQDMCGSDGARLFLEFATDTDVREVPDPYYGGGDGFERVLDLIEDASRGLLEEIRRRTRGT